MVSFAYNFPLVYLYFVTYSLQLWNIPSEMLVEVHASRALNCFKREMDKAVEQIGLRVRFLPLPEYSMIFTATKFTDDSI